MLGRVIEISISGEACGCTGTEDRICVERQSVIVENDRYHSAGRC